MLDLIRKKKDSVIIKAVFAIIVFSFIATIFLVWGKGEDGLGKSGGGYAVKVDRTVISPQQYENSYKRLHDIYQQLFGQVTPEIAKRLNLRQQVIDRLIDNVLLTKGAKELGIKATKDDVAAEIAKMPAFQKNGAFDYATYQQILKMSRITPTEFEDSQKADILIAKTRKAIMDKATVSDDEIKNEFHKERDRIELLYTSFAASDVSAEVKLTDADLEDHMKKNSEKFKIPEKAAISYFFLDPSSLVAAQQVTPEEQETFYRRNMDRYLSPDNTPIPFESVKDKVIADAKRQKAAKQLYEKAADILFQNIKSGDLNMIAGKLGAKISDTPLFSTTVPPQALAGETALIKKALELKQGELGGPLETAKGIYIFKVKEKKAAELPPLAQVRSVLEQQVRAIKAAELAKQKAVDAQKQLAGPTFASIKTQATASFAYSPKGEIPSVLISPPLMEAAFKLSSASPAPTEPFLAANSRWYAIRLKLRSVAPETDLAPQKEIIRGRLLPAKQDSALKDWLKERRAKSKIDINPALKTEQ